MPQLDRRSKALRILALLFVIGLSIYLYVIRDQIRELERYGYLGIFLISVLANATVIIPLPGVIIVSTMGAVFDPFFVALAAGLGAAIGELSGYLAGFSGQRVVEQVRWHDRMQAWMKKYGPITILLLAFIPNPAFDMAGITAGALKIPVSRFLLWCALGKILKMMVFAYGGSSLLNGIFAR